MNFNEALKKVLTKRITGLMIGIPAIISTIVSIMKMLYFRLDDGSQFGGAIAKPFKSIVAWVYENTHSFIGWFWEYSPTPDQIHLNNPENIFFILIYLCVFIAAAFLASAKKLSNRLRKIKKQIEDQLIAESIRGKKARSREQIENETQIPEPSIFNQFHQLYLAPIAVALIAALLLKLLNL